MKNISFQIEEWDGRRLDLTVETDRIESLRFRFDEPVALNEENLAIALSTLCGTVMDQIHFGFPLSDEVTQGIAAWTRSEVLTDGTKPSELTDREGQGVVLNFSGGLDSFAAKLLLGSDVELVSIDFGGRFSREREFFKGFKPKTVSTNLVETTLRKNSWSFMGIGPLLLAEAIHAKYFSFGSIIEAAQLRLAAPQNQNHTFPPFKMAGFENAAPVIGISEAGTVQIVLHHEPDLLEASLRSLASPGEEKYYRKIALAKVVAEVNGMEVDMPELPKTQRVHYTFGQNFAVDLTALFLDTMGYPHFANNLVDSIPSSVRKELVADDFRFMRKADQNYYAAYPEPLRKALNEGLSTSEIEWYREADYESVAKVRRLLAEWYTF